MVVFQTTCRRFDPDCPLYLIFEKRRENGISTNGGYESFTPYKEAEKSCQDAGFDTIVFVPSMEEEDGCVTCGNAILGRSKLKI